MALTLDFSDLSPGSVSTRDCRRGAVFALRILLNYPDIRVEYMEDCKHLLRLLGKKAVWPQQVTRSIAAALDALNDDDSNAKHSDGVDIVSRLKGRHAWTTYEQTISRWHTEQPKVIIEALEDNLARLKPKMILKTPGNRNTTLLTKLLGLNPVESRLLDYAELSSYDQFRSFIRTISISSASEAYALVASAIDAPVQAVRSALRASSAFSAYGLVALDTTPSDLEDFLRLDKSGQAFLGEDFATPEDMLQVILQAGEMPNLAPDDYPHLKNEFTWLTNYLKHVASGRIEGGNILFYGAPGTGKSEFARLLAQQSGLTAYDVKSADNDGDPVSGNTRLRHFALSQRFLAEQEKALIIFDEIEDVFPDSGFSFASLFGGRRSTSRPDQTKAWINQQLEHSPVPAIWISNSIDAIDAAFLRRFAFHIEFRTPPKTVRERVIKRCLNNIAVSEGLVRSLAADNTLSPAQISQASRFASLCATTQGEIDESVLLHAIKASQAAMGRSLQINNQLASAGQCNFAYLNLDTEIPVDKIEQALRRQSTATLCFYGIPGAGKTSLAHHLADAIGRPLMVKRASDILGMYVGESEKKIAQMFRDANQEGAVLLLDEADSFLRSRQQAKNSWEVTQVNELLQQMENFDGIFICTTNLMEDVDEAAMRRFTFKVRFNALTQAQREAMFAECVFENSAMPIGQSVSQSLQKLNSPTPGDFATVQRQEKLLGERYSPEDFLARLERECGLKKGDKSKAIGFLT